jgi:Ca2+-binding RTX toxin-like protein
MPLRLALVAAVGLVLAAASPASAADVETRVVDRGGHSGRAWEMVFTAAPGERNAVTTTEIDDYTLRITDAANPVTAGSRCRSIGAHTVECSTSGLPYSPSLSGYLYTARVIAGDRDDTVRSAGEWGPLLVADGGTGSDFIEGALKRGDDLDGGGGGTDRLFGRGNSDTLTDGDDPAAVDADVLDGGDDAGEQDTVSYARRTAPLTIDLADADTDGEQGEGDTLTSVESAVGGAGDDTLDGTPGPNWLRGGAGDDHLDGHGAGDTLEGQAGDDLLHGHTGDDALHGGTGADRLRGDSGSDVFRAPTRADTISCGTGASDTVSSPGAGVRIPTTCDTVSAEFDEAGHLTRTDEGTAVNLDPIPVARTRRTLDSVDAISFCPP